MSLGLNKWCDLLVVKSLPVLDINLVTVKTQMANHQLALADYARSILNDAALASLLMKAANQSRTQGGRQPLTTLGNALSHLGRGQLEQIIAQLNTVDQTDLSQSCLEGYKNTLSAACHAAELALDWGRQRNVHQPEEMQLAALLQFLPELLLWCFGGRVMLDIEQRCYGQKQDYDQVAEHVLGCSIRLLGVEIANAWALPELVAQGLSVRQQDFTLASGVMLAAHLARLVQHSWYNAQAHRCLKDIARYKGQSLSDLEPHLHQHTVNLSEHFLRLGFTPPARLLPMLVDEDYVDPKYSATSNGHAQIESRQQQGGAEDTKTGQAQTQGPASSSAVEQQKSATEHRQRKPDSNPKLAEQLVKIREMVKQHVHARELIQAVIDAIQISGFDRVVFAVKVPQKKILYGRFFAYSDCDKTFEEFIISIAQPNLFSLLMNKPQQLWLNDDNRNKYWSRIPDKVKLMLQSDNFMVKSIFTQKHSVGLIYADTVECKLVMENYKIFQLLCKLLVDGMIEISHHQ